MTDLDLAPIEARVAAAISFFMPYEVQEAYQNLVEDGWMPCDANVMANSFTDEAALLAEVKRLRRERDAAVEDITHECDTCKYARFAWDRPPCENCIEGEAINGIKRTDNWEWRTPAEEGAKDEG
jgi:hypothetical protein